MSRVGKSDPNRDLETKHKNDLREIRAQHSDEVTRLKDSHQQRVDALQEASGIKLSAKDAQYQKEIESLKALQQKRRQETKRDVNGET